MAINPPNAPPIDENNNNFNSGTRLSPLMARILSCPIVKMNELRPAIIRAHENGKGVKLRDFLILNHRQYLEQSTNEDRPPRVHGDWCNNNGEWPPDLNPLDYSVWSILEEKACAKPHPNVESLKRGLKKAWNKITLETLIKIVDNFPKRLKACMDAKGGHFE
uniref:DDE-1 domain-containing protein n=1 Tax=Acrobeloides nanus TaxID=290746 RepID=A0A914CZQ5_9BILA